MELFSDVRARFHDLLLKKELPHHQVTRSSVFLDTANSVGVLFDATDNKDVEIVLAFSKRLEKEGKRVKLLGYIDENPKAEIQEFNYFTRKELDWALRPKAKLALDFSKQPFDLLVSLSKKSIIPLDYLAAYSKARFRIGPFTENTFCYDLMIEPDKKAGLQEVLAQMLFYLENMQSVKSTESAARMTAIG